MTNGAHKELASGVARKNPNKQWYSKEGTVVENEQEGFGLDTEYGSNASQAKDGNVGGG